MYKKESLKKKEERRKKDCYCEEVLQVAYHLQDSAGLGRVTKV
jgi:hypothetical protein